MGQLFSAKMERIEWVARPAPKSPVEVAAGAAPKAEVPAVGAVVAPKADVSKSGNKLNSTLLAD